MFYSRLAIAITVSMGLLLWSAYAFAASYSNDASIFVRMAAVRHHVPVDFALKVAQQETGGKGGRCGLRGSHGEVGPLQILPSTARAMGYRGVSGATCEAQTDAGMKHLALCYNSVNGNQWLAAACHNQGISVAAGAKVFRSARRYANAVTGTFTAPARFVRLVMPQKANVVPVADDQPKYRCNWSNCPK